MGYRAWSSKDYAQAHVYQSEVKTVEMSGAHEALALLFQRDGVTTELVKEGATLRRSAKKLKSKSAMVIRLKLLWRWHILLWLGVRQLVLLSPLQHWTTLRISPLTLRMHTSMLLVRNRYVLFLDQSGANMQARKLSLSPYPCISRRSKSPGYKFCGSTRRVVACMQCHYS